MPVGHGKQIGFIFFEVEKTNILGWKKAIFWSYSIIKNPRISGKLASLIYDNFKWKNPSLSMV